MYQLDILQKIESNQLYRQPHLKLTDHLYLGRLELQKVRRNSRVTILYSGVNK